MNLTDLDTFVRVAETGSFTKAAAELDVPKSTVSRRVSRLEDDLGVELLQRTPRAFSLSEHGKRLQRRCAPALRELLDAERSVADEEAEPRGRLKISAPYDLGNTRYFAELVKSFQDQWPEVSIEIVLANRLVDLVEEGFDLTFRLNPAHLPGSSSLMTRQVIRVETGLYASPDYLKKHGRPKRASELKSHRCITNAMAPRHLVPPVARGVDAPRAEVNPFVIANDFSMILALVQAGVGIGLLPEMLAGPHTRRGELERVLPRQALPQGHLSLVWPATRHMAPRVRAFIDHVMDQVKAGKAFR